MNVIILAGGYAERLWPLTKEFPKTLLVVGGKPVLYHLLENVRRIAGVSSITVAIDENKVAYFEELMGRINVISTVRPKLSLHSADTAGNIKGPLMKLEEILDSHKDYNLQGEDFLVLGGDNVFGFDLNRFCDFYREQPLDCNAIHKAIEPLDSSQYGLAKFDGSGRVTWFREKPMAERVSFVSTACYCLRKSTIEKVRDYLSSGEKEALGLYIGWLAKQSGIMAFTFEEPWYDVGRREDLLGANAMLLRYKETTQRAPDWIDGNATVVMPVHTERDATIRNSSIGPCVYIGSRTMVVESTVENSVVYEDCYIHKCSLRNSIVGPGSEIEGDIAEAVFGPKTRVIGERQRR